MKRTVNIWTSIDKTSILIFLLLVIAGWFNIYAAVYNEEHKEILDFSQRYGKQFIWILATIILAIFIVIIDNRFYFYFAWFIYAAVNLMLALVLVLGTEINGARSWFEIGGFSLQPSEFAKFGTGLALASFLARGRQDLTKLRVIIPATAIILLPAFLIALQPDMGSTVVFFAFFIVLFREGMSPYIFISGVLMVILFFLTLLLDNLKLTFGIIIISFILTWFATKRWKPGAIGFLIFSALTAFIFAIDHFIIKKLGIDLVILVSVILFGAVVVFYALNKRFKPLIIIYVFVIGSIFFINSVDYAYNNLLQPHQKERVGILLGFESDVHGTGYNLNQSLISIGSGGLTGKGYLQGTQTKFRFVPAQSTDFIFCTVGEEWGFIGSLTIIGLYLFLLLRLIIMAERQRSVFSRIYGYGVASVLFTHVFINIGMAIGLVPVIGIPLPFFSYGGSSLWSFTFLLFIFLRLDASRTEYMV